MFWDFKKAAKCSSAWALSFVVTVFAFVPENAFSVIHTFLEKFVCSFDIVCKYCSSSSVCIVCNRILLVLILLAIFALVYWLKLLIMNSVTIKNDDCKIIVQYGNILKCKKCKKVINFDECFTAEVGQAPQQVKPSSLCGQYLTANPSVNIPQLLEHSSIKPATRKSAYQGKDRYESGTILPNGDDLLLAFVPLNESGLGQFPSYKDYINSLSLLWQELDKYYCQKDVCVPILGSGLTRFGEGSGRNYSQQELLNIMIWSYKISPYKLKKPCTLRIICQKKDDFSLNRIDK